MMLELADLSPRERAYRYTEEKHHFVSESSADWSLKAADLVTSPAYILTSASGASRKLTARVHEVWQEDFARSRIVNWGWCYLLTVPDDFLRHIIAWTLSPTTRSIDATETLDRVLAVTGIDHTLAKHRPRLLSDNGPAYRSGKLREYLGDRRMSHTCSPPHLSQTQSRIERNHQTVKDVVKL